MKKHLLIILSALIFGCMNGPAVHAQDDPEVRKEFEAQYKRLAEAHDKGDLKTIVALKTADFHAIFPDGRVGDSKLMELALLQTATIRAQEGVSQMADQRLAENQTVPTKEAQSQSLESIYTDLDKQCRTLQKPTDTNLTLLRRCPGVGGYKLLVHWDDERVDITVVTPRNKAFDLGFRELITTHFSDPGPRAEWRAKREGGRIVPVALIVRVNAQENADTSAKLTPYLAVSKITNQEICITDKVLSGPKQNEEARRAADQAVNKPCLKRVE